MCPPRPACAASEGSAGGQPALPPLSLSPLTGPRSTPIPVSRAAPSGPRPARSFRGKVGGGSHLALAGLSRAAPHEALVDGPQVLLPVIHFEAAQVRAARRRNHQLRVHGLALRLGPGHHWGQGPAARGGRRKGRGRRQRGARAARLHAPAGGATGAGTKRGQPWGWRRGGGGQPNALRAALPGFAEGGAGQGAETAGRGYVIPRPARAPQNAGSRPRPAVPLPPPPADSGTTPTAQGGEGLELRSGRSLAYAIGRPRTHGTSGSYA